MIHLQAFNPNHADPLVFREDSPVGAPTPNPVTPPPADCPADASWKIMLVDDDESVHQATKIALRFFTFEGKTLQFISAYSGEDAKHLIQTHPDTALILLDVVMETTDAGLQVAQHIREVQQNTLVRIILRTGQPGQVPEESVVLTYDINDYKTKLELTQQKLFTTLVSSLRSYRDLLALQHSQTQLAQLNGELQAFNQNLEHLVAERTEALEHKNTQLSHEIEDRQKAEMALRVYIHALTHDLRNPVTGMVNVLTSLQQRPMVDGELQIPNVVLERMVAGCDRQLKMISRLIDAHEIDVWGVALQRQPFSLTEMVQALAAEWEPSFAKKRIQTHYQVAEALPIIDGDRNQVWRVFENLLSNVLKFNPPGITVTVTVTRPEHTPLMLCCTVRDTGIGIASAQKAHLFELYQRGTVVHMTKGLGIGLYICRQIIEAHGGTIGVNSELGEGAEFWFTLPAAAPR